jgi:antirestriction protein ArdC
MSRTSTTARTENYGGKSSRAPRDHYQEVTDRIIAALEAGTPPWRRPWDPDKAGGPAMPRNAVTGQRYRGINTLTLGMSVLAFESGDPRWATYKQAEDRGWQVRRGERGTTGYFFKRLELRDDTKPDDDEDAVKRIPLLRAFTLFHASQIEGIPDYVPPTLEEAPWRAPEAAEIILANSGAVVRYGGDRAFYSPTTDHIQMPPRAAFATAEEFCGTLIHEASHWTGAESRLNRDLRNRFGSHDYAREELRAEIGQMMVCGELGIAVSDSDFSNNAAYVASWLERLRSDRKEIFRAAADAQRTADYLLAFHPDYANSQAGPPESMSAAGHNDAADAPEPMSAAA